MEKLKTKYKSHTQIKEWFRYEPQLSKRDHEKGQVLIFSVLLLPLIGFFLLHLNKNIRSLVLWKKQQQDCRSQSLVAHQQILIGMKKLMQMNSSASKLRLKKKQAEAMYHSALEPKLKAAAFAYLQLVIKEQVLFQLYQKSIIVKSKLSARYSLSKIKNSSTNFPLPFLMKKEPEASLSPSYFPKENLNTNQKIITFWKTKDVEGKCGTQINFTQNEFNLKISYPDNL